MKLQLGVFLSKIRKEFIWLLILILLLAVQFILKLVNVNRAEPFLLDFLSLIGFPAEKQYNITCFFIFAYEFILMIYYVYIYYVHDLNVAFENVVLRANERKWIKNKILLCGIFVVLMNTLYILIVYFFYRKNIVFDFKHLLHPLLFQLMATYLVITMVNFVKRKNYLMYALLLLFTYMVFSNFNIYITSIMIILLIIINIKFFHFKRYYKNIN